MSRPNLNLAAVTVGITEHYSKAEKLFEQAQRGDVKLLKASELAKLLVKGRLTEWRRQDLEFGNPEVFADEDLLERCLWEAEAAAKYPGCAYPGVVVISYAWRTRKHPDPSGSLGKKLAVYLHWYAVQRARWTRERLCKYAHTAGHTWYDEYDFDWEFVVLIDFWSLYQEPRTPEQTEAFHRARLSMHEWFGHRGTMVMLLTEAPADWRESEEFSAASAEFEQRGDYDLRGWPSFERRLANLRKARGMCLDMAGFEQMLEEAQVFNKETCAMDRYAWRAAQLTGIFAGAAGESLQSFAMDDFGGLATEESCLFWLTDGTRLPPLPPASMDAELRSKRFAEAEDLVACMDMYREALAATVGAQLAMDCSGNAHWSGEDLRALGGALAGCGRLTQLNLQDCRMGDAGLCALANRLEEGWLPQLEKLNLRGNEVGNAGMAALADALRRGAMPKLTAVAVSKSDRLDEEFEKRITSSSAARVTLDGNLLSIERSWSPAPSLPRPSGRCRCAVS